MIACFAQPLPFAPASLVPRLSRRVRGVTASVWGLLVLTSLATGASAATDAEDPLEVEGRALLGAEWRERAVPLGAAGVTVTWGNGDGEDAGTLRVTTTELDRDPFGLGVSVPTAEAVAPGEVIYLRFRIRSLGGRDGGHSWINVAVAPPDRVWSEARLKRFFLRADPEWKLVALPIRAEDGAEAGALALQLGLGQEPQSIEVAGVEMLALPAGTDADRLPYARLTYPGRETSAAWRDEARARIEQIRKGDLRVRVEGSDGEPIAGAEVSARMQRHAFPFGTAIKEWILAPLEDPARFERRGVSAADQERYVAELRRLFSAVVTENGLKWHRWEDPRFHLETLAALRWLKDEGFYVRGHAFVWPNWRWTPPDVRHLADHPDALQARIVGHVMRASTAVGGLVDAVDLVNEPYSHDRLIQIVGEGRVAEWFSVARAGHPQMKLFINENDVLTLGAKADNLEGWVRRLRDQGVEVDGVGFQAHFHWAPTPPEELLAVFDRFGALGLEVQITEYDMLGPDPDLQRDFFRDLLIASFSHPDVTAFLMWGFWDGAHYVRHAPLFEEDWTLKPTGQVWMDLVMGEWWTDAGGRSDAEGVFATRGFLGEYVVTARHGGREVSQRVTLPRGGGAVTLRFDGGSAPAQDAPASP